MPLPRFRWWVDYVSRGMPRSTSRYSLRPLCRLLPSIRACAVPAMAPSAVLPPAASITSLSTGTFQLADVRGRAERPDDGGDKPGLRALLHWEKPSDSRWAMSRLPFDQKDNFASPFCSNCPGYPNCNQEVTKGCHFTALGGGRRSLPPSVHDPNCGDQYKLSNPSGDTVRVRRTDSNADGEKGWGWNLNFDICKSCQIWTGKGLCVDGCLELSGDVCLKWG